MYVPQDGDEGLQLLGAALRDYLAADPTIVELLPNGVESIVPEGFFTAETPTPALVIARLSYGQSAAGAEYTLVRYIVYAMDRGRGFYNIDKLLFRLGRRLNDTASVMDFLSFPPESAVKVFTVTAPSGTATASFPTWRCEGDGVYLFIEVSGLAGTTA